MKMSTGQFITVVVLIVIIAVGAALGITRITKGNTKTRQAVFLTNGQVYFGYTKHENAKVVALRDIYYLQVQQQLQQSDKANTNQQPQISLVKLGNELHGPVDEMRINRDQILFIEDMKDDSKVNEAIAEYVKNGNKPVATPTPAQ